MRFFNTIIACIWCFAFGFSVAILIATHIIAN